MDDEVTGTDPTGRYIKFASELGRGAYKTVYKAIDRDLGIEVAWNEIRIDHGADFDKLWNEVTILQKLSHPNVLECHDAWIDEKNLYVAFITECMTSGTLRQFIRKAKSVKLRVIKRWCIQILEGLKYLHTRTPPIIHRDIKCDNIFINGNIGELKIGDLGLATNIVNYTSAKMSVIGTPEFMAPELYEESYNEKVDIWAFGMCVLELATLKYPYAECTYPAQIFKKVMNQERPKSLSTIKDEEVFNFISECLKPADERKSAAELLDHPFLQNIDDESNNRIIETTDTDIGKILSPLNSKNQENIIKKLSQQEPQIQQEPQFNSPEVEVLQPLKPMKQEDLLSLETFQPLQPINLQPYQITPSSSHDDLLTPASPVDPVLHLTNIPPLKLSNSLDTLEPIKSLETKINSLDHSASLQFLSLQQDMSLEEENRLSVAFDTTTTLDDLIKETFDLETPDGSLSHRFNVYSDQLKQAPLYASDVPPISMIWDNRPTTVEINVVPKDYSSNPKNICLSLRLSSGGRVQSDIEFDYHIHKDTSDLVSQEMIRDFELPINTKNIISQYLESKVQEYLRHLENTKPKLFKSPQYERRIRESPRKSFSERTISIDSKERIKLKEIPVSIDRYSSTTLEEDTDEDLSASSTPRYHRSKQHSRSHSEQGDDFEKQRLIAETNRSSCDAALRAFEEDMKDSPPLDHNDLLQVLERNE